MAFSLWQRAWEEAEPRLRAWEDSQSSPTPHPRVLRVGQLDAELLDEELVQTLQEPLAKAFSVINTAFRTKLEPELALIIRLTLYKFSVWNLGATYGAKLQDLRYSCANISGRTLAPSFPASGLPKRTLAFHAFLTVVVPYFHARFRGHALSNAWPDTPSSDRRRKTWNLLSRLESLHSVSALLSFVVFLWNGRYRTLADRLLSMRLVPSRRLTNRQVSYEFMNRQMVWHAFTEFLLLILPLFSSRAFRRVCYQINSRVRNFQWSSIMPSSSASSSGKPSLKTTQRGRYFNLPLDQCAVCAENASFNLSSLTGDGGIEAGSFSAYLDSAVSAFPSGGTSRRIEADADDPGPASEADEPPPHPITTPYVASCGHVYCFFCLSERLIRAVDDGEDGWECLRCCEVVRGCERVHALRDDDSVHTSDGWASEVDDLASFESDTSSSLDGESE
ncbi:Pex12 amino terminal region-domain-containing protein [Phellopilus nigrolimitatus]|nr:Pex12 amino terminal region-domain-containing protein [Phellopilus nigrolimitatus]